MGERRQWLRYVATIGFFLPWMGVCATTLEIVEIDPEGETLHVGAALHVKVHYSSDKPVRIQSVGMRSGAIIPGLMNASPAYRQGEGDVLSWVAFDDATEIETVRVTLFDSNWVPLASKDVPMQAVWSESAPVREVAPWVPILQQQQKHLIDAQNKTAASKPSGIADSVFGGLFYLAVPAYLIVQIWLAIRWRDRWRIFALLPLLVMIPIWLFSFFALSRGSNLWPLWIIFISPLALGYLLLLGLVRRIAR